MRWLIVVAAAVPGIALAAVTGASGAKMLLSGEPLIFSAHAESLAEAAANRDTADVVLRLALGEDPNLPAPVRLPYESNRLVLTPLEGAVVGQRVAVVRLLVNRGAKLQGEILTRVRCFAQHRGGHGRMGDDDTIAYLASLDPSPLNCEGIAIPEP